MIRREEQGQVTLLIIGFASVLVMVVVVVINASAAYLQRQGLDNLADGAALQGADLGSTGVYGADGLGVRLDQEASSVRSAVHDYLTTTGAHERYPGIRADVRVNSADQSVTVTLRAPMDLPLTIPGAPPAPLVGASSTAAVRVGGNL
ncbi:MAG: pilus assembly protein TadG-related protein [Nocardioides sp.]|nr:pilus assembly protein TadG-related protein [Nocardioides sp.]